MSYFDACEDRAESPLEKEEEQEQEEEQEAMASVSTPTPPKRVFIVPYRNRSQHKFFFCKYMNFLLENQTDCEIYFSHQCDTRSFNRGATKNIGFLAIKDKYPNDYGNMTFVFHDIDTMPFHKLFDYSTSHGVVKHYYGFKYALGGIVAMTGYDFEKINGFPNFWGWGMEDNVLQKRCEQARLFIDRSHFYQIGSHEILQLFDGVSRIISQKDPWRSKYDTGVDGVKSIRNLRLTIDLESANAKDNIFVSESTNVPTYFINITNFVTSVSFENDNYVNYDLRDPPRKIINPNKIAAAQFKQQFSAQENWTNIPYYPNFAEKSEDQKIQKEQHFLQQEQQQQQQHQQQQHQQQQHQQQQHQQQQNRYQSHQRSQQQAQQAQQQQVQQPQTSQQLRQYYQQQPSAQRATKSANIGLGGVKMHSTK